MKASVNLIVLQTEEIDNLDVMFLQLKTHLKEIVIRLIYRTPVHNISSDIKLFDQIIELNNSFESAIFGNLIFVSLHGEII